MLYIRLTVARTSPVFEQIVVALRIALTVKLFMICCILQQVKYHARGKTRTVRNCLQELRHDKIEGGGKDAWRSEKLFIPPVPPSYLLGCSIIDIRYLAMVRRINNV